MKTLTVDEAMAGLPKWVALALTGEEIQIRQGDSVVELRPAATACPISPKDSLTPREALRQLQQSARLTPAAAENYLREVRDERLATEGRHAP